MISFLSFCSPLLLLLLLLFGDVNSSNINCIFSILTLIPVLFVNLYFICSFFVFDLFINIILSFILSNFISIALSKEYVLSNLSSLLSLSISLYDSIYLLIISLIKF